MQCYCGDDTSSMVDIYGLLETRGETRFLGGVCVYWLFIKTYNECPRHSEHGSTSIIELLHEITEISQM